MWPNRTSTTCNANSLAKYGTPTELKDSLKADLSLLQQYSTSPQFLNDFLTMPPYEAEGIKLSWLQYFSLVGQDIFYSLLCCQSFLLMCCKSPLFLESLCAYVSSGEKLLRPDFNGNSALYWFAKAQRGREVLNKLCNHENFLEDSVSSKFFLDALCSKLSSYDEISPLSLLVRCDDGQKILTALLGKSLFNNICLNSGVLQELTDIALKLKVAGCPRNLKEQISALIGSAVSSPAPAMSSPAPAMSSPAPAMSSPAPAMSSPAPAVRSPAPAMSSPAPAMSSPAPAMRSPAPAMRSPAPAMRSPAPAVSSAAPISTPPQQNATYQKGSSKCTQRRFFYPYASTSTPAMSSPASGLGISLSYRQCSTPTCGRLFQGTDSLCSNCRNNNS